MQREKETSSQGMHTLLLFFCLQTILYSLFSQKELKTTIYLRLDFLLPSYSLFYSILMSAQGVSISVYYSAVFLSSSNEKSVSDFASCMGFPCF